MPTFPVSQEEHLCRWCSRHDVLLRTWARAWGLVLYSYHPHPPGHSLVRLSCLVYYCLVCCLPPASCRPEQDTPIVAAPDRTMSPTRCGPEQDTPILALPLRRRRRCTRIAFGCAQDIRTINEGRFCCLPTTTRSYFIWCQHTVLFCTINNNRVKEKRACKEGNRQKVLHRQCQQYRQFHPPPVLLKTWFKTTVNRSI